MHDHEGSEFRRCYVIKPWLHLVTVHTIDVEDLTYPAIYFTLAVCEIVADVIHEDRDVNLTASHHREWWRIFRESTNRPSAGQTKGYKWATHPDKYYDTLFVLHMCETETGDTILDVDLNPDGLGGYLAEFCVGAQ